MVNYVHHMLPNGQCTTRKGRPTRHSIHWKAKSTEQMKETCFEDHAKKNEGTLSVMRYHDNESPMQTNYTKMQSFATMKTGLRQQAG